MTRFFHALIAALLVSSFGCAQTGSTPTIRLARQPVRYLAFQLFTNAADSRELGANFAPSDADLLARVTHLRDRIGTTGTDGRRLGFFVGPISFDLPDAGVRAEIDEVFEVALATGVAGGLHLDDSMFWARRSDLDTIDNVEWLDWRRMPNTGRRLDWSPIPSKIAPQLCLNSVAVKAAVAQRAALIGDEVKKGVARLHAMGKDDLFIGVIAGWETQIGRDFDTGRQLGYCALTNAGFSAAHPPPHRDDALAVIVKAFASLWARSLVEAGVPRGKVYSHIAFLSRTSYTPPAVAFCDLCIPGFSTYPQPGQLEQWQAERALHGDPAWASSEGTAIDPGVAARNGDGMPMETYLGNLFNHGAQLVNVFGWDVGPVGNAFRRIAEGDDSLGAYRKFLSGETLAEAPIPIPEIPPTGLPDKLHAIMALLPGWVSSHGPTQVQPLMEQLDGYLKRQQFVEASRIADEMLRILRSN